MLSATTVREGRHLTLAQLTSQAQVRLTACTPGAPDLAPWSHSLALSGATLPGQWLMYFALNGWRQALECLRRPLPRLPPISRREMRRGRAPSGKAAR